jgi:hypothetical protein
MESFTKIGQNSEISAKNRCKEDTISRVTYLYKNISPLIVFVIWTGCVPSEVRCEAEETADDLRIAIEYVELSVDLPDYEASMMK